MSKKITFTSGVPAADGSSSRVLKRPEVLAILNDPANGKPGDFKSVYWDEIDGTTHVTVYLNVPEDGHKAIVESTFSSVANKSLIVRQKRKYVRNTSENTPPQVS